MEMEKWAEIRTLSAQGLGIRSIAKKLKISRKSVRKALKEESHSLHKRNRESYLLLEPFQEKIAKFLKQNLIGTRILNEIRKLGYHGSKSTLYNYLKEIKKNNEISSRVTERYETLPGQQAQFDWSCYSIDLGGNLVKIIIFCFVLSYSRRKFYFPTLSENQSSVFEALEKSFWYFGGIPKELLVDNARVFVSNPDPSNFKLNPHFLEFCGYYKIKPRVCRIRRCQTKGKVERPFFILEQHFIKGRTFKDFQDLTFKLQEFSQELDVMTHSTTGFRPIDRFEEEKEFLTPLPPHPFVGTFEVFRKVNWDCLISFGGSRYSVPYKYAGKYVWIRISQGEKILIFSSSKELIASHKIAPKGSTIIESSHYDGLRKAPRTLSFLKEEFQKRFPEASLFLEKLLARHKFHPEKHLKEILEFSKFFTKDEMLKVFSLACECNTLSHNFIKALLLQEEGIREEPFSLISNLANIPKLEIKRSLKFYQKFAEVDKNDGN